MKYYFSITIFALLFNLILVQVLFSQTCVIDSIGNQKLSYNQFGKLTLISHETILFPYSQGTYYKELFYNQDTLLESVVGYSINILGDTVDFPLIIMEFEYSNGLLSRIILNAGIDVIYDDIVWNGNKIVEFKYYYLVNGTIDSTQTRILVFTYLNENISHFLYKELTGQTFSNLNYQYDNKYNPYYNSEIALVEGDLFKFSCKNNWINNTGNTIRTINYNQYDYPLIIETNWGNGNYTTETYSYNCINSAPNILIFSKTELYPNPSNDYIKIRSISNESIKQIKIIDKNGKLIHEVNNMCEISVRNIKSGLYLIEISFEKIIIRKKIIIYAS